MNTQHLMTLDVVCIQREPSAWGRIPKEYHLETAVGWATKLAVVSIIVFILWRALWLCLFWCYWRSSLQTIGQLFDTGVGKISFFHWSVNNHWTYHHFLLRLRLSSSRSDRKIRRRVSPSGTVVGSISRVIPINTECVQILLLCVLPCPLWSSITSLVTNKQTNIA